MKTLRWILTLSIVLGLAPFSLAAPPVNAQDAQQSQATALMRGYRTGYSDGYQAGLTDAAANTPREFRNKTEYGRADRAYSPAWGSLDDYQNGYRQGFGVGYEAGYDHKPFDSSIPADLKRAANPPVLSPANQNNQDDQNSINQNQPSNNQPSNNQASGPVGGGDVILRDTIMRVELMNNLSTDGSQKGDPFQVRVVDPKEYDGAIIQGHIAEVKRPGKAKGTAELQLAFDEIKLVDGHSAKFSAQVIEVIPNGGSRGVDKVDSEGGVQGQRSTKSDATKVGGAAGIGAIIGLITGGGSGAAIGATIGAGVGTAGVLTSRGKDIRLIDGQQLRIRTAGDAQLQ